MAAQDIIHILIWWFVITFIGGIFFPFTSLLFQRFFDRGYIFAKIIGITILSYVILIIGSLHIFSFSKFLLLILLGIFLLVPILLNLRFKRLRLPTIKKTFTFLSENWKVVIFEECLFLVGIFFLSFIRSFEPSIHGLEKYMDYGFINSILRSRFFPPKDMWLTPFSINYYYFGHFTTAVLTKLSGISSNITFNLMLATVFSFCFSASFSIGSNLAFFLTQSINKTFENKLKIFLCGLLAAILVTFSSNLQAVYTFFLPYENEKPVPFWQLEFSLFNPCYQKESYVKNKKTISCSPESQKQLFTYPNSYWYPNATRFIHNTIHEFPIYSWVVADLHGHVLDIPFVLLTIAVLLSLFISKNPVISSSLRLRAEGLKGAKRPIGFHKDFIAALRLLQNDNIFWYLPVISFLLAVMYMTNAWDGIIYMLLAGLLILYILLSKTTVPGIIKKIQSIFIPLLISYLVLFISFIIFSLPFNTFFKPFVSGIGILNAPNFLVEKKIDKTKPIVRNKTFATSILGTGHCQYKPTDTLYRVKNITYQSRQIGPFLFEPFHCQRSPFWQLLILYGFFYFLVFSYLLFLIRKRRLAKADVFVLLLVLLATFLIILPEFIYVKDIYPDHYRANTMFKLVFQAFIMLSLCGGYIITRLFPQISSQKSKIFNMYTLFLIFLIPQLYIILSYPYLAINSYYGLIQPEGVELNKTLTLDGTAYLKQYPTDYEAILWLNKNISGQPVILEAQGDSYTDYARVSANTGLPTVLGWTVHEWLWRGRYDIDKQPPDREKIYDVPAPRLSETTTLYESNDLKETKRLVKKYNIQIVFLGDLERQKYPNLDEAKWEKLGKVIFQKGKTKIYKIV